MRPVYPCVMATMRALHTAEDTVQSTSLETYLRGELLTYSEETLRCYSVQLFAPGFDCGRQILEETAHNYGFDSLEQLERRLRERR